VPLTHDGGHVEEIDPFIYKILVWLGGHAKYRFETFLPLEGQVKLAHLIKAEILRQMAI
jgi:hypothetical protein